MPEPPGLVVKNGTNSSPDSTALALHRRPTRARARRLRLPSDRTPPPVSSAASAALRTRLMSSCSSWCGVRADGDVGAAVERTGESRAPGRRRGPPAPQRNRLDAGRRQPRQLRVGGRETAQRVRAAADHLQAIAHVALPVGRLGLAREQALEAVGDRLDRRQRVVDLVADDTNQTLPRLALFVAQRAADIGQHQQLERHAALPEWPCRTSQRPGPAGKRQLALVGAAHGRGRAPAPVRRRSGPAAVRWAVASRRSPARFTSRSRRSGSNAKTAT